MSTRKLKSQLESDNKYLKFLVSTLSCPSPVKGYLPVPIPEPQRACIDAWLAGWFSNSHHGQGYFDGLRFCVIDPTYEDSFPVPFAEGVCLMVKFSNTDECGTHAADAWLAVPVQTRTL